jgi:hypothetical protein
MIAAGMTLMAASTAFAAMGSWKSDEKGTWWQISGGWYPKAEWDWIDGDNSGTAYCYYFDSDGYLVTNATTPDGYTVNENGQWTVNGEVQKKATNSHVHDVASSVTDNGAVTGVTDSSKVHLYLTEAEVGGSGLSMAQTVRQNVSQIPNKTYVGKCSWDTEVDQYQVTVDGEDVLVNCGDGSNPNMLGYIYCYEGVAKNFLKGIPEEGISMEAALENLGWKPWNSKAYSSEYDNKIAIFPGHDAAIPPFDIHGDAASGTDSLRVMWMSSGDMDRFYGLPAGSYFSCMIEFYSLDPTVSFQALLTEGADGKYYIFPDSKARLVLK